MGSYVSLLFLTLNHFTSDPKAGNYTEDFTFLRTVGPIFWASDCPWLWPLI